MIDQGYVGDKGDDYLTEFFSYLDEVDDTKALYTDLLSIQEQKHLNPLYSDEIALTKVAQNRYGFGAARGT